MRVTRLVPFRKRANGRKERIVEPIPPGETRHGLCNICGNTDFRYTTTDHPRENSICLTCRSTSRDRMLVRTLGHCIGETGPLATWPTCNLTLMETSSYRGTPELFAQKFRHINLVYASVAAHAVQGDLSQLCLRDASLDVLITSDVFEHVRHDEPAWREVYRVLKPNGYLVLQVPCLGEFETTQVRVDTSGSDDVFLMEPEYHAENTLVYRYFGRDLLPRLQAFGFAVVEYRGSYPEHCISEQTVVVAQKASYVRMGPAVISDRAWT